MMMRHSKKIKLKPHNVSDRTHLLAVAGATVPRPLASTATAIGWTVHQLVRQNLTIIIELKCWDWGGPTPPGNKVSNFNTPLIC